MSKAERLKKAREDAGFETASDAARALGIKIGTYTHHENGTRDFDNDAAEKYARRFGVPVEWLTFAAGAKQSVVPIKDGMIVKGEVRAGSWLEIDAEDYREPEYIPFSRDMAYARATQYALLVVGNSMNKVAQAGQYVIVADWPETGLELRDGDLVVVRRDRSMTYEVTLKRARKNGNGWELWPESTDPQWQKPIQLDDKDVEVSIVGKVIGKYERL